MMASLSGNLATMGPSVPYAIAAKLAWPERPVVALAGDGAMQMNGMAELITVAKYWKEWKDPRWIVLVLDNRDLNQVTWEQRVMAGDPKLEASQDLPAVDYAGFAESLGLAAVRMERPEDVAPGWERAFSAGRPCLVQARVDPSVPPLPPHITFEEARKYMESILKGDPDRGAMVVRSWKDAIESFLPHRS
jgi:pyruvate dehydrogenase (quinone)